MLVESGLGLGLHDRTLHQILNDAGSVIDEEGKNAILNVFEIVKIAGLIDVDAVEDQLFVTFEDVRGVERLGVGCEKILIDVDL